MDEVNAVSAPQEPVVAPVADASADTQAQPSAEAKPELFDLSPLGDSFKDIKVDPKIAEKLPGFLKDLSPEEIDHLSDAQIRKLYVQSEKGYRAAHAERFDKEHKDTKEAETKLRELTEKEQALQQREAELAEIEGDAFFYRDEKVKRIAREAAKEAEELGLESDRAEAYVNKITKPYLELAKQQHKEKKAQSEAQLKSLMEGNAKIGRETFPEIDPTLAAQLVYGFTVNGSDPQSAAQLFRKELDRVIEYREAKAVTDYVKKLNIKQPDTPTPTTTKPVPSAALPNEMAESVKRGQALYGFFGK